MGGFSVMLCFADVSMPVLLKAANICKSLGKTGEKVLIPPMVGIEGNSFLIDWIGGGVSGVLSSRRGVPGRAVFSPSFTISSISSVHGRNGRNAVWWCGDSSSSSLEISGKYSL